MHLREYIINEFREFANPVAIRARCRQLATSRQPSLPALPLQVTRQTQLNE
jgi:hypothetical protein